MAIFQIVDNFTSSFADTKETAFKSDARKTTVIESFTAANTSTVNASYTAYIVSNTGVIQPQRPFKIVVWGENDLGIGIVNQAIPPGGSLVIESSVAESIYFTVTGREIDS